MCKYFISNDENKKCKIKPLKVRLNIEQHFFDTGIIEMSNGDNEWKTLTVPEKTREHFIFRWESFDYRIKKTIQYRPWTNDDSKSIIFFKSTGWISFKNLLEDYDRYEIVTGKRYMCGMEVTSSI